MTAYYNEHDKHAAQYLRNLIAAGHIAAGDVDERSIEDVHPDDLRGYTQCHFFAGVGVWSYALRRAGWPDDRPVWTGSCPCQPFSAAGKGVGFADERHLWPAFNHLISQCGPAVVFGEQVASADGLAWFDLVHADLEAQGYAVGGAIFALRASVRRTSGNDSTGWPTPTTRDWKDGSQCDNVPLNALLGRVAWLAGWPTPMAGTPAQNGNNAAGNTDSSRKTVALAGWNTPAASDGMGGKRPHPDTTMTGQHPSGRKVNMGLASQAHIGFINTKPARLTATGELLTGASAGMESGGQLSPAHSRWLMGLPPEWDACAPMATRSSRKLPPNS